MVTWTAFALAVIDDFNRIERQSNGAVVRGDIGQRVVERTSQSVPASSNPATVSGRR
jgi:hypothetical protein